MFLLLCPPHPSCGGPSIFLHIVPNQLRQGMGGRGTKNPFLPGYLFSWGRRRTDGFLLGCGFCGKVAILHAAKRLASGREIRPPTKTRISSKRGHFSIYKRPYPSPTRLRRKKRRGERRLQRIEMKVTAPPEAKRKLLFLLSFKRKRMDEKKVPSPPPSPFFGRRREVSERRAEGGGAV